MEKNLKIIYITKILKIKPLNLKSYSLLNLKKKLKIIHIKYIQFIVWQSFCNQAVKKISEWLMLVSDGVEIWSKGFWLQGPRS